MGFIANAAPFVGFVVFGLAWALGRHLTGEGA